MGNNYGTFTLCDSSENKGELFGSIYTKAFEEREYIDEKNYRVANFAYGAKTVVQGKRDPCPAFHKRPDPGLEPDLDRDPGTNGTSYPENPGYPFKEREKVICQTELQKSPETLLKPKSLFP